MSLIQIQGQGGGHGAGMLSHCPSHVPFMPCLLSLFHLLGTDKRSGMQVWSPVLTHKTGFNEHVYQINFNHRLLFQVLDLVSTWPA